MQYVELIFYQNAILRSQGGKFIGEISGKLWKKEESWGKVREFEQVVQM